MIAKARKLLNNLKGKTVLAFHKDADGICSAALIYNFLKEKPEFHCIEVVESDVKFIFNQKADNYIFVDLAINQFKEVIPKNKNIIIIDHHPDAENLNSDKIFHLNSHFLWPKKYISASQICEKITKGKKWIMRLGAVGDAALKGSPEELEAVKIIDSIKVFENEEGLEKILKSLASCKKIEEFICNPKMLKYKEKLDRLVNSQVEAFLKEKTSDMSFFRMKTPYSITSIISNVLFSMFPNDTIIIYRKSGKVWKISGRSENYDMGKIFAEASAGIGSGGGHAKAAGAQVTDIEEFIKRVKSIINRLKQ